MSESASASGLQCLRLGTRNSPLALAQTNYIQQLISKRFPDLRLEQISMTTLGDKRLDVALGAIGDKGLFVKELEVALLAGEIDVAIHSYKDMPTLQPEGLTVAPIASRKDYTDALVCGPTIAQAQRTLATLPEGCRIGTSSVRRQNRLQQLRPDCRVVPVRGNVNTRLAKMEAGEADALILASAGLSRLGFAHRIHQRLDETLDWLPAPAQGILAIEYRTGDADIEAIIHTLQDTITCIQAAAERGVLETMESGCHVPLAVYASVSGFEVTIAAHHVHPEATKNIQQHITVPVEQAQSAGQKLGKAIRQQLTE